jgi:hypothetical protein
VISIVLALLDVLGFLFALRLSMLAYWKCQDMGQRGSVRRQTQCRVRIAKLERGLGIDRDSPFGSQKIKDYLAYPRSAFAEMQSIVAAERTQEAWLMERA